ncbi:MAG TPA: NAD+ synthase [Elusimicrobia bacterium]|nr:NAD+ synthase [Elusimicrobiota bacterium]HBT62268.1 NAD+ synthase [Elusimicrobiota bacterium]
MRIALAQINTTVADFSGNLALIRDVAARARAAGAELAVFPEQTLGGYPALDLWEDPDFLKAGERALQDLARKTGQMGLIVGCVARNPRSVGKPIWNAAALLHRGKVAALRGKCLLPTYDVFDERRYFEPATANAPIRFRGLRIGLSICEDSWYQTPGQPRLLYLEDPVMRQIRSGVDVLINVSASPFERDKTALRERMLRRHARRAGRPFLYCNQVGGNDDLIFDGNSLVFDGDGRVVARGRPFREDMIVVDTEKLPAAAAPYRLGDVAEVEAALVLGIHDYLRKCGQAKAFVGLSGGIDSAVVAALAVKALGPGAVTGVTMPSPYSCATSVEDAQTLARNLGIRLLQLPITELYETYLRALGRPFGEGEIGAAEQNIQARIRGNLLMALANKEGGLLLSTGNKSELSVGYCTLYGDMCGGLAVIADVPKATVYELARWINREHPVIPQSSIDKAPSAELKPGQKDQDDLPPYETLDAILAAYVEKRQARSRIARRGHSPKLVRDVLERIDRNEYKRRQAAPSLKISPKAFGVGRRMPIARGSGLDF